MKPRLGSVPRPEHDVKRLSGLSVPAPRTPVLRRAVHQDVGLRPRSQASPAQRVVKDAAVMGRRSPVVHQCPSEQLVESANGWLLAASLDERLGVLIPSVTSHLHRGSILVRAGR